MSFSGYRPYFEKASMYKMLADYYRDNNPTLHEYYHKKHIKNIEKMISSQRSELSVQQEKPARVRVLHAAPGIGNVDIYLNGMRILKNFPYKKLTHYLSLPKGKYQIDVYPVDNLTSTLMSRKVEVAPDKMYTLAATGSDKNFYLLAFEDEPHVPTGEAKLRFVHLSPDTPPVDVAVKHGDTAFSAIPFRKATPYLGVTPMTLDLEVRPTGSDQTALSLPNVQLQPNTTYSIYAIGLSKPNTPNKLEALILIP